jgi:hypothetical protein
MKIAQSDCSQTHSTTQLRHRDTLLSSNSGILL